MSKQMVLNAYRQVVEPELRKLGFIGRRGHLIRRLEGVTQIVELQHSIYGGRITANLGLDLEWLPPMIRWIPRPALGPHAHDATRWIRVGLTRPEKADLWWPYQDSEESAVEASRGLGKIILKHGIGWLRAEADPASFLDHAERALERSKSPIHPQGGFIELRLLSAVHAWAGDKRKARRFAKAAGNLWDEERTRLKDARQTYRNRHPGRRLPQVPNLQRELETLIAKDLQRPNLDARFVKSAPKRTSKQSR